MEVGCESQYYCIQAGVSLWRYIYIYELLIVRMYLGRESVYLTVHVVMRETV